MIHSKKFHMLFRQQGIGPGGWDCPCCAPAPGKRKAWCRDRKRGVEKRWFDKHVALELG